MDIIYDYQGSKEKSLMVSLADSMELNYTVCQEDCWIIVWGKNKKVRKYIKILEEKMKEEGL